MVRSAHNAVLFVAVLFLCAGSALANSVELLNFQGLGVAQQTGTFAIGNFYDGGGFPGTNYGVTFSSNFLGLRSAANGGSGNFAPTPVGTPAIFIIGTTGSPASGVMNVSPGFSKGINFFYTAGFTGGQTATITVWSGVNGTGTVLATIVLGNNTTTCVGAMYCTWSNAGASFSGTAYSVTFNGPANELGIADITIGRSTTAVPESDSIYLLGTGLVAISLSKLRRFFGA
jgi:hypothetical protein